MEKINKQRKDYLTWDEYFMGVAILSSLRSKDPSTQVGACIVSADNRILSIGYNGTPNGFLDDEFPWARDGFYLDTKYPYVCHAELNAISNFRGNTKDLENARMYVTLFPCNECTKLIIQNGIKEIIYLSNKYKNTDGVKAATMMLERCNVKTIEYPECKKKVLTLDYQKK